MKSPAYLLLPKNLPSTKWEGRIAFGPVPGLQWVVFDEIPFRECSNCHEYKFYRTIREEERKIREMCYNCRFEVRT